MVLDAAPPAPTSLSAPPSTVPVQRVGSFQRLPAGKGSAVPPLHEACCPGQPAGASPHGSECHGSARGKCMRWEELRGTEKGGKGRGKCDRRSVWSAGKVQSVTVGSVTLIAVFCQDNSPPQIIILQQRHRGALQREVPVRTINSSLLLRGCLHSTQHSSEVWPTNSFQIDFCVFWRLLPHFGGVAWEAAEEEPAHDWQARGQLCPAAHGCLTGETWRCPACWALMGMAVAPKVVGTGVPTPSSCHCQTKTTSL